MSRNTVKIIFVIFVAVALTFPGLFILSHFLKYDSSYKGATHYNGGDGNGKLYSHNSDTGEREAQWIFEKVQDGKLIFQNGHFFATDLFDLEYIGQFPVAGKAPFLIFSGRDCNECDANISIYIHSPSDGKLVVENGQNRYQYPGTERDYETDTILSNSRAFYGNVLEGVNGVIWYGNRFIESEKIKHFVFLSYIDDGSLKDTIYEDDGKLEETISLLNRGLCKEIEGRQYHSEP